MKYFQLIFFAIIAIFIFYFKAANGADNQTPIGFFDIANCNSFGGWTCDGEDFAQPLTVNFYADNPADAGGMLIGSTTADLAREQAVGNMCGGNVNHGFNFLTPAWLKDGKSHTIYAYAVNTPPGIDPLLTSNPKTIQCGTAKNIIPSLWFVPLPVVKSGYGCSDYMDLFNNDAQWQDARKKISVFKLYGPLTNWSSISDGEWDTIVSKLNQWGIDIGLEEGAVKEWGCTGDITAGATILDLQKLGQDGGKVKYISMDEPFIGGQQTINGRTCNETMDQLSNETIKYINLIKQNYPDIIIGDIEPYPFFSESQLEQWITGFKNKSGDDLPFFQVDINYPRAKLDNNDVVGDLAKLSAFCKARNIKFAIIAGGATWYNYPTPIVTDKDFYDSTLADAKWTLAQVPQDYSVVQSWTAYPQKCLPDSSGYSFTQLTRDFAAAYGVPDATRNIAANTNNAQFISQSVPSTMNPGQIYPVTVRMKNTGTKTWNAAGNYHLGSQNPQDNTVWGLGRVDLAAGESLAPSQTKTFTFNVTAPVAVGTYNFRWKMVQDGVEWFGDMTPNMAVTVQTQTVPSNSQPAKLWLARSANTKGVWTLASIYRTAGPGTACLNGHGWSNTNLSTTKIDTDGSISEKTVQVNCSRPWGSPEDKLQILHGYWANTNSSNMHDNVIKEEVMPDPGLIFTPVNVIPDGQWHAVTTGCYTEKVYVNNLGSSDAAQSQCYDTVCQTGENCPGANTIANTKYIIYNSCEGFVCDGQAVPVKFYQKVDSVMRVAYTAVNGCGGSEILTEEQWYIKNYGYAGFANTSSGPYNPSAVDVYALDDETNCLPFWNNYCPSNNECLAVCFAGAVSGCKVCKADGSAWADTDSKCSSGQTCSNGICQSNNNIATPPVTPATPPIITKPVKQMTRAEILARIAQIKILIIQLIQQLIIELQKQLLSVRAG